MKITTFLLFSCAALSISACQNTAVVNQPVTSTVLSSQQFSEILQQHTWTYTPSNSAVPILVNLSNQALHIYSGCNQISKVYELNNNHLQSKSVQIQTLMDCGHLQDQENLASKIFSDTHLTILNTEQQTKQLKVTLKDGSNYNFQPIPYIVDLTNYDAELLKKFTWQQISEEPGPDQIHALFINFTTDRMLFYAGCNGMSMQYSIDNNKIIPRDNFISQVKFCGNSHHERQIAQTMSKPMNIKFDYSTAFPKLILESKYQPDMIFQATPRKDDLKLP